MFGFDAIEQLAHQGPKRRLVFRSAQDVVVGLVHRHRPDGDVFPEDLGDALVGHRRADAQLQGDGPATSRSGSRHAERDGRLVGLPGPGRRLAMALAHGGRDNVAEQTAELDQQGLRRQREDAEMAHLLPLYPPADLGLELPAQVVALEDPVGGLVVLVGAPDELQVDRLTAGRMVVGRHGREDGLGRNQGFVFADVGPEADDVRRAVFVDRGHDLDPALVLGLHGQEHGLRVAIDIHHIDELVMFGAHQHQVLERPRQLRRAHGVAARVVNTVADNMGDEAEGRVFAPGDQVADLIFIAASVLAASAGASPKGRLRFLRDRRLGHQARSTCRPVPVHSPVARQPS